MLDRSAGRTDPRLAGSSSAAIDESWRRTGRGNPSLPDLCLRTLPPPPRSGKILGRWLRAAVSAACGLMADPVADDVKQAWRTPLMGVHRGRRSDCPDRD